MSKAFLLTLMGVCLIAFGLQARKPARAVVIVHEQPPATAVKTPNSNQPLFTANVTGKYMISQVEAQQDALRAAKLEVQSYLQAQSPPINWEPPLDYVQGRLIKNSLQKEEKDFEINGETVPFCRYKLQVEINAEDQAYIQAKAREERMERRMLGLGKLLAGLVLAFAAVAGFLRLDDRTKGFYTGWLKLGVIALAAAVAGLFLWA
jgi:hypothetical protein